MLELDKNKFIQENSPDGGFLQSEEWRKFQEAVGRKTFCISSDNFHASIIEHQLPIVGRYFYIPRWPSARIFNFQFSIFNQFSNSNDQINKSISYLIKLAKQNNIGWIRIEPADEEILEIISKVVCEAKPRLRSRGFASTIKKAPHDMQPREILVLDIAKSEEELLAEMKAKTRYNIKLSRKRGVSVKVISNFQFPISNEFSNSNDQISKNYVNEFIKLVKITAKRDGITPHPESYYRKMFETIPSDILKLYVAEYKNKIIAASIIIHYGNTATYLHGASDNECRNVMAPYLLQWQAILDAKKAGLERYDLGGVKSWNMEHGTWNSWTGITKFKTGFLPNTKPIEFPGSYDIIINSGKYFLYRFIRKFIP